MNRVFQRPVFERVRRLCLALPQSAETSSWDHPNFRAGKKTFCTFEMVGGRPSIAFRLSSADAELVLRRKQFFATPYGRGQWASAWVDKTVDHKLMARLVHASYREVATKRMLDALDQARMVDEP